MQDVVAQEDGIHRLGENLKKGGESASHNIKPTADALGKDIKKATVWIGKKMQQGGEKLEKASK